MYHFVAEVNCSTLNFDLFSTDLFEACVLLRGHDDLMGEGRLHPKSTVLH